MRQSHIKEQHPTNLLNDLTSNSKLKTTTQKKKKGGGGGAQIKQFFNTLSTMTVISELMACFVVVVVLSLSLCARARARVCVLRSGVVGFAGACE